jgi:integrase
MDIYQRNARWWYDARAEGLGRGPLIPPNGKLATDDEEVAKVLLAKMIRAHAIRQRAGVSFQPVSLADFAKKSLLELEAHVSRSHLRNLKADFAKLISSTSLGGTMVDEVTRPDVLAYLDERRSAAPAPSPATLRRELMALSRLMAAAVNRGLRIDNPCYRIGAPRPTEPAPKPLEPKQAAILLHLALSIRTKNALLGPIIATLLYTGARIGEALLIDVADVRLDEGAILVPTLKQRRSRPPRRRLRLWPHLAEILRRLAARPHPPAPLRGTREATRPRARPRESSPHPTRGLPRRWRGSLPARPRRRTWQAGKCWSALSYGSIACHPEPFAGAQGNVTLSDPERGEGRAKGPEPGWASAPFAEFIT